MSGKNFALVTGTNWGIGFEVCRQMAERHFVVLLIAGDVAKARSAAVKLGNVGTVEPLLWMLRRRATSRSRSGSSQSIWLPRR